MRREMKKIAFLAAAALVLSGCGGYSKSSYSYDTSAAQAEAPATAEAWEVEYEASAEEWDASYYDTNMAPMGEPEAAEEEGYDMTADAGGGISSTTGIDSVSTTSQKLIKTVSMSMETKEFDPLLENIRSKVEELGGYIENSEISGSSYYSVQGNRYAWMTLRIPADKLDGFVTIVSELGNVTSKNESVQDITLRYVDVESHKKALETEQDRLLELLEKAESMEDIITIESRLSELRYELQSYGSTLRTYDNQVNYSTVSISISEVERVTPVIEEKTFFEEIRYRLSDNLYDIGQGMRDFAIWFISSLPYLFIWAVVIALLVCLVKILGRRKPVFGRKKKKRLEEEKKEENKEL